MGLCLCKPTIQPSPSDYKVYNSALTILKKSSKNKRDFKIRVKMLDKKTESALIQLRHAYKDAKAIEKRLAEWNYESADDSQKLMDLLMKQKMCRTEIDALQEEKYRMYEAVNVMLQIEQKKHEKAMEKDIEKLRARYAEKRAKEAADSGTAAPDNAPKK